MMSQHSFSKNVKHTCPCSSIKNLRGVEIFHDNHTLYCFVLQILKKAPEEAILLDNISTALSIKFPFFREMPVYELNSIIKQEIRFLSEYFEDFIHINNDGFCYFESKTKDEIVEISDEEDNVENILPHRSILGTGATLQPASISDQEPRTQNQVFLVNFRLSLFNFFLPNCNIFIYDINLENERLKITPSSFGSSNWVECVFSKENKFSI